MSETQSLEFAVYAREAGTSMAKKLRRNKQVPAVVYGPGQKSLSLSLDLKTAERFAKKEYKNKIFTFKSDAKPLNGLKVLKKDTSYHLLTRTPLHIDFLSLDMSKKVRVSVNVMFTGKPKGVKEAGGILNIIQRQVEIECLPSEIPESFSIDVSPLEINQNFHVKDLKIPSNIKLVTDKSVSLCAVQSAVEEEKATSSESDSAPPATEGGDTSVTGDKAPPPKQASSSGGSGKATESSKNK